MDDAKPSMNFFQRASMTAAFFTLTFLVTGIALNSTDKTSIQSYLFDHTGSFILAVFIANFRVKILLDDHKHFGEPISENYKTRFLGFIIGLHSWIFWGLASLSVNDPGRSCYLLFFAIFLSIIWLFVDNYELAKISDWKAKKEKRLNYVWVGFNLVYMVALGAFALKILPPTVNWLILLVPIRFLIIDYSWSRSFEGIN